MVAAEEKTELDIVKDQIKEMILKKRKEKLQKIEDLKKAHDRKKRAAEGELQNIRATIAGNMIKASIKGDATICDPKNYSEQKAVEYCDKKFWENINDNEDCKDPTQFCDVCCKTEIGEFHGEDREACLAKCESNPDPEGNWIWIPGANKITQAPPP